MPATRQHQMVFTMGSHQIAYLSGGFHNSLLICMMSAFRAIGTALLLPPGTPKDRVEILKAAVRRTHTDPAFINEYRKLTGGDEPTPLMPDDQAKVVKEIPRDAETIELFKKFAGTGALPSR